MNIIQRITKNAAALFAAHVVSVTSGLLLTILIARILGDTQFGKYTFVLVFTALFGVFIDLGYDALLIREVARDNTLAKKYFGNVTVIRLVLSIIVFSCMVIVINLMNYPSDTKVLVYLFGVYLILGSFAATCRVTFRAFEKMEYEMVTVIIKQLVMGGLGIVILLLGYGLRELALVFIFSSILELLVSFFICGKNLVKPILEIDINFWKQTIKTAIPLSLITFFGLIHVRIDIVMLSVMKGDAVVGWYNAAYSLVLGLKPFPQLLLNALFPLTSIFFISSKASLSFTYEKAFKYLLIVSLPMAVGITLLADRFILLFYGPAFDNSVIALQILAWDILLIYACWPLNFMLLSMDKQNKMTVVIGITALINIILNLILIPHFNYVGAAIATITAEAVLFSAYFYLVSDYLTRLRLEKIIIQPLIACAIMAVFIHFYNEMNLALLTIAAGVIYFAVLYLAKGISPEDVNLFKQLIRRHKA
ncbi:flippase [Chloroflexota bacterium]